MLNKNILIWGINYKPEVTGIGPYNTLLCNQLKKYFVNVNMLTTFPYYPMWKKNKSDLNKLFEKSNDNSVNIYRCWHYVPKKQSAINRLIHEISFIFTSFFRLITLKSPDILIVISPPIFLGLAAILYCFIFNKKYILHIQDMQPDAAIKLGMIKNKLVINVLKYLEMLIYKYSSLISVISNGMIQDLLVKKVPKNKIYLLPNTININYKLKPNKSYYRKLYNISDDTVILTYSGNLGIKQGLLKFIKKLNIENINKIKLFICGEGGEKDKLQNYIDNAQINKIILLPLLEEKLYYNLIAASDILLITQANRTGSSFLPSKLLIALGFKKPVLGITDDTSELGRFINRFKCGYLINTEEENLNLNNIFKEIIHEKKYKNFNKQLSIISKDYNAEKISK